MAGDWYYAQGDQRLGPVSLVELRSFLQSGRIQKGTLVWTDGMQDWTAAGDVKAVSGSDTPDNLRVPMGPPLGNAPSGPPSKIVAPEPPTTIAPALPHSADPPPDLGRVLRAFAWPLVALGLCLVVASKGCDMLAHRQANYLDARTRYLASYYSDESSRLTTAASEAKTKITASEVLDAAEKTKQVEEIDKKQKTDLEYLEKERVRVTHDHAVVTRDFVPSERSGQYWRGLLFVIGTGVLVVGLVGAYVYSEGHDRWVCLILLGIIIYAIYTSNPWQ